MDLTHLVGILPFISVRTIARWTAQTNVAHDDHNLAERSEDGIITYTAIIALLSKTDENKHERQNKLKGGARLP